MSDHHPTPTPTPDPSQPTATPLNIDSSLRPPPTASSNGSGNGSASASTESRPSPALSKTHSPMSAEDQKKLNYIANMPEEHIQRLRKRLNELQASGMTKENSSEVSKMSTILDMYARAKSLDSQRSYVYQRMNRAQADDIASPAAQPPQPTVHVSMTPAQINQLRSQAASYQLLSRGQQPPTNLQQAAQGVHPPGVGTQPSPLGDSVTNKLVEKTVEAVMSDHLQQSSGKFKTPDASGETMEVDGEGSGSSSEGEKIVTPPSEPPYAMEFDPSSIIYPYNAFTHPDIYAHRKFDEEITNPLSKMQRQLVPAIMPRGLDPYLLIEERNRYVETRMSWRMTELEEMASTFGLGQQGAKDIPGIVESKKPAKNLGMQARIELLSLRLLGKQRLLREDMVRAMHGAVQVPADRSQFRRFRTHTLRDARATEQSERRQRTERERRGKERHLEYINSICEHGQAVISAGFGTSRGQGADKMRRLGQAMIKMHKDTEREEQRRIERLAKERLKALKNDDEDAYLALLGEAKDSRIGHLLKQTDQYLETLAAAVVDQQNDAVHRDQVMMELPFEQEDGPASEATFGARRQDGEEEGAERKAGKVDYYAVAHRIQEKVTKQANILTGGTLKDYQVKGLQWMISLYNNRLNGILADEMGLGKTIQTISLITYLIESKRQPGPFIVIVPLSTLTNWTMEFDRWAPSVRTVILKGSPLQRREQYARLRSGDFQVCLTTYEYIIKERPLLSKIKWVHMIIDEGHRMKNVKSKLSQTLNEHYSTRYRLILTGTPLQNNLPELWALLNFVLPKIFNSVKSFDEWFNAPFANTGGEKMEMNEEEALLVVKRLHKVLRPFLLRRLKKDVESELPDKVEKIIYTKMSALQWKLYESVKKYKTLPTDMSAGKPRRQANLQNAIMQLRKICNHPFVFREVDEDFTVGTNIDEQIVRTSGKFELLDRLLPKLFRTGHKVLIFFQMTEIMTIIADFFDYRGWKYCRLDGSTKADDRQQLLSTFNDPSSPYQVFILSTRAGGLGLNLQSADTVIIYDTDWNPFADLQAQDRAHRIGQKKEVRVLRLISSGTVEELVLQRAQQKLEIDGKVIQAGKFDDVTTGAEYEALLAKAFEANADDDNEETNELDDDELNELLARGDQELGIFTEMDKEREREKLEHWRAEGNKGPLPPPLMQDSELPPFYRRDIGDELAAQVAAEEESGRGRRAKAEVKYTDGLTDEQWLNAVDASDDDVDEAVGRKRARIEKRAERKRINEMLAQAELEGKPLNSSSIKSTSPPVTKTGMKKRGRPSHSATPSVVEDLPLSSSKRRRISTEEKNVMQKIYKETNALTSAENELLNTYFVEPVNKNDFPDYFAIIKKPICMKQIKKKIDKDNSYGLEQFKIDMHQLWDNARTYNQEESWVYNSAEDMQEFFDKIYEEEINKLRKNIGEGIGGSGESNSQSGTSTPMFKADSSKLATKIRLNIGKKLKEEKEKEKEQEQEQTSTPTLTGTGGSSDESDEDDY
ncbi:hypothetical protein TREMEDRAFT_24951 [Tremella mesenterica DSM 1558]|uniref:uncharacterized protein n=1 Tax=Tremella mesenterica (strain ATCC 24925 / CBS 8224 / DSM 1558 / NBRC 9311 / NRRL Y-6157 / RJB 2259-6 / UBC 559-6) TaxID=578456 RepID=UPI0003F4A3B8|nr:uncharacterized protein TREMEDRAFT_24951 [Tremella mesenterica DSM 1558]EIW73270.1 hypothetical protein TREMEDRAFT_24951 [Tremella mesenterica DSM 1558]